MESSQDFDGTREFEEESLKEEIKEELIETVFDITGNEVNSSQVESWWLEQIKFEAISLTNQEYITVGIWGLEIAKKVWRGFKYLFHTYLMSGSQK